MNGANHAARVKCSMSTAHVRTLIRPMIDLMGLVWSQMGPFAAGATYVSHEIGFDLSPSTVNVRLHNNPDEGDLRAEAKTESSPSDYGKKILTLFN
ncbi:hypothetical protein B296_00026614 [Ensete ventricosum]|uniref:Uncharacterized protein n=1 Tax=Ensete ventricosum TaxID=4639 RepID=A0A426ZJH7_ENSVE|nr:hypothetical protein B296_00026614 [Ensete ventricosum]